GPRLGRQQAYDRRRGLVFGHRCHLPALVRAGALAVSGTNLSTGPVAVACTVQWMPGTTVSAVPVMSTRTSVAVRTTVTCVSCSRPLPNAVRVALPAFSPWVALPPKA